MNASLIVARHELKTMYRRRVFQIITVGIPVLALVGLLVLWVAENVFDGPKETDVAGYVDATGLFTGHLTQADLKFVAYATQDEGMGALLSQHVDRLYVIPADYLRTGLVQRFKVGLGFTLGGGADSSLQAFLLDNLSEVAPESEVIERLKDPVALASVDVDSNGNPRNLDGPRVVFFLGLAFLLMFSLAITGSFFLQALGEEKESRVMEVLLSSVTPGQFMIGKILGLASAGLSQVLIWVASGLILLAVLPSVRSDLEFSLPGVAPTLLAMLFFVLGYLLFATLNAGIGAVAPTRQESQQLSVLVAAPMIIPIYAWVYIAENPTAGVVKLLTFSPFTAPLVVLQRLGPEAIEPWEVATSLVILALAVAGGMLLVGRLFRAFLLSYGKRPGVRLLWRAIAHG